MSLKNLSIVIVLAAMFNSCFEAPDFSTIPEIGFDNVVFIQGDPAVQRADTLRMTITYQDGDGNLGLNSDFNDNIVFAPIIYFTKSNGQQVNISDVGMPINVEGFSGTEVPPYTAPYICQNWEIIPGANAGDPNIDTVFFVNNINSKNIFVKLFKEENGEFIEVDFTAPPFGICGPSPLNARFPVLKDLSESAAPINGSLTYAFPQFGLFSSFENDDLKLEIQIQDRDLNKSNTVTTETFRLIDIRGN